MLGWEKIRNLLVQGTFRLGPGAQMVVNSNGSEKTVDLNEIVNALDNTNAVETLTAAKTLVAGDSGKTYFLGAAGGFAVTLPAPAAGLSFAFKVSVAPSGGDYTIVTNGGADVLIGGFNELEVDTADDGPYSAAGDTITLNDGVAVVGDCVDMVSDGTSWYLKGQTNADGGAAISAT